MSNVASDLKEKYIKGLLQTNAFLIRSVNETPFTLRSGKQSYLFLDHARVATSPNAYQAFVDAISDLVSNILKEKKVALCNVDSKISAQLVGSVAYNLSLPQFIYKSKELTKIEKGTQKQLTGDSNFGGSVAILDDVMTGGDGTAKNVADLVKTAFPKVKDVQIFVGFIRDIRESTYQTHYVITRDELLDSIWNTITDSQKKAIEKEKSLNEL